LFLFAWMWGAPVQAEVQAVPTTASQTREVLVLTRLTPAHFQVNSGYGGAYGTMQARRARLNVARRIARANGLTITDDWPMPLLDLACFVMEVPAGKSVDDTIHRLSQDRDVMFAEPMGVYTAQATSYDDPLYRAQPTAAEWHLASLHQISTGRGIDIAVIDSGIESSHPDLEGQVTQNLNFVTGQSFRAEDHGTGIAGVIAAKAGNHLGIVGVAPGARLWGLRACWQQASATVCDSVSLAKALHFAVERGAQIINMSLAGPPSELLDRLINVALARKMTVVAAYDAKLPDGGFPASHRDVIAVAEEGQRAPRPGVYLAPGRDVITTQPGGKWNIASGSSFAAAHVSGLLALMRARSSGGRLILTTLPGSSAVDACATLMHLSGAYDCAQAKVVVRAHL
jgi:subtilisin family serine protease